MPTAEEILKKYWGHDAFRPLQKEIIQSVLQGFDTMALLPTGGGKSLCYQLPALMMEGFCLVVTPLISLMQDQVQRLKELEIPAACLHSGMHYNEVKRCLENMLYGPYKLLYVSPERLQTKLFKDYLPEFNISLVAVDEAHCVSQWGHDFREDYLKIKSVKEVFPSLPFLALTATATEMVQKDIATQLQLQDVKLFQQSFKRENIFYQVAYSENKMEDTMQALQKHSGTSIIYCRSRKQTEALSVHLNSFGIKSLPYHAGMSRDKREAAQKEWTENKCRIIVATTAFGMGIDKADVRLVLHYEAPEHPEAYYQEAGRAGRDGKPATAICLYNSSDIKRLLSSTALQYPSEDFLKEIYQSVCEYLAIPAGIQPDKYFPFDLADFCKKFKQEATPTSYALRLLQQEGLWTITESVFQPAALQVLVSRQGLDELMVAHPEYELLIISVLRLYGGVFYYPTPVRLLAIAKQMKAEIAEVEKGLGQLDQAGIIAYSRPLDGPRLFFHSYRVPGKQLLLNLSRIRLLKQNHEHRTQAMIHLLETKKECRERFVLSYFGEKTEQDCGHCDYCLQTLRQAQSDNPRPKEDAMETALKSFISEKKECLLNEIIFQFEREGKEKIIAVLRTLMEEGIIQRSDNGYFRIGKK